MTFDPSDQSIPAAKARETVSDVLAEKEVSVFVKGTEQLPQCGYSQTALGLVFHYRSTDAVTVVNVLQNLDAYRDALEAESGWSTIPQVFVDGEFVGGCDILTELNERGELGERLQAPDDVVPVDMDEGVEYTPNVTDGPF